MIFTESPLAGAYTIELDRVEDERGYFARTYDAEAFAARGVRWNDPALAIHWPIEPAVLSARDAAFPLLDAPARA